VEAAAARHVGEAVTDVDGPVLHLALAVGREALLRGPIPVQSGPRAGDGEAVAVATAGAGARVGERAVAGRGVGDRVVATGPAEAGERAGEGLGRAVDVAPGGRRHHALAGLEHAVAGRVH